MADGQGQIYLSGTIGNRIHFNNTGIAVPSLNTRSLGTKIVLFPSVSTSTADFAIGVELGAIWNTIGATTSAFKWYTNATNIATLSGNGNFNLTGTLTTPTITLGSTDLQTTLSSKANWADVVPCVYDSLLQSYVINANLIRPKKTGGANLKVDCDLAVIGACNISPGPLVVDGTNIVNELLLRAPTANPTFAGTVIVPSITLQGTNLQKH